MTDRNLLEPASDRQSTGAVFHASVAAFESRSLTRAEFLT